MKYFEKHPMLMILTGIVGISLSSIFVKYSAAPSSVTAAFLFGEIPTLLQLSGGVLILGGVYYYSCMERGQR